jgi:hypothetical protein
MYSLERKETNENYPDYDVVIRRIIESSIVCILQNSLLVFRPRAKLLLFVFE